MFSVGNVVENFGAICEIVEMSGSVAILRILNVSGQGGANTEYRADISLLKMLKK